MDGNKREHDGSNGGPPSKKPRLNDEEQVKVIVLVGGPSKGTRFRPISFDTPKPLVPVAGLSLLQHHVNLYCSELRDVDLVEIILLGFFPQHEFDPFCADATARTGTPVRYLMESESGLGLGTGGGLLENEKNIVEGFTDGKKHRLFVVHCDVMCAFPFRDMLNALEQRERAVGVVLGHIVASSNVHNFGCVVHDPNTNEILHYVEKPDVESPMSNLVNCGVYLFDATSFFSELKGVNMDVDEDLTTSRGVRKLMMERDFFPKISGEKKLFVLPFSKWWLSIKDPKSCLECGGALMKLQREWGASDTVPYPVALERPNIPGRPLIVGDVTIHPSARVHPSAKIGPNVSIGEGASVEAGVRVANSTVLERAVLRERCCVLHSIVCSEVEVGSWARIEGNVSNRSESNGGAGDVCVLGKGVQIAPEIIVRGCVVLPHKGLSESIENRIIL